MKIEKVLGTQALNKLIEGCNAPHKIKILFGRKDDKLMKMYEVEFLKTNKGLKYYVCHEDNKQYIDLGDSNVLIVEESDLEDLKGYGNGIKNIKYIGELYKSKSSNTIKGLTVNIKVDRDDIKKQIAQATIEELSDMIIRLKTL
jgi:hypothetical protein